MSGVLHRQPQVEYVVGRQLQVDSPQATESNPQCRVGQYLTHLPRIHQGDVGAGAPEQVLGAAHADVERFTKGGGPQVQYQLEGVGRVPAVYKVFRSYILHH